MFFKKRAKAEQIESVERLEELAASGQPVLIDFWQANCQSCRTMAGIVDELADEYSDSAHVVKIDVGALPQLAAKYSVRATPTFVLVGRPPAKGKKKSKKRANPAQPTLRWRNSGLVRKDVLAGVLESNGAVRAP